MTGRTMERLDRWTERMGDWLNPILVKETRQTLKSRQFIVTFSLLLLAAWGWTAAAIAMSMPRIYYVPSGQPMLVGYYLVLAVPMLLVVPLAAHRSLAAEVDDGTLDLLSVTNLSPLQIITGKLASGGLQMMLYFVALMPCVAFCYVLRGVDLMTIGTLLGGTAEVATLLTVVGLFLAALPSGRGGQFVMMVVMLILIGIAEFAFGGFAIGMITQGGGEASGEWIFGIVASLLFTATVSAILLIAAAVQLAPPSENRSTPLRRALLVHQTAMTGCLAYAMLVLEADWQVIVPCVYYAAALWAVIGALMVGESGVLTPRVRRDLPGTFLGRALAVWLTPGPGTGLVFSVSCMLLFSLAAIGLLILSPSAPGDAIDRTLPHALTLGGYLMLFLSVTRWIMQLIRLRSVTHPGVAVAVLGLVASVAAIAPYSAALHLHDYRSFPWSHWQLTNWAWTIVELESGLSSDVPYLVFGSGATLFALNVVLLGRAVLPQRVATPERVLAERAAAERAAAERAAAEKSLAEGATVGFDSGAMR
ncbi:ABC transporter permease [Candidatus Laterigemmans baculatus]|uniref:ABC transporter permease n=1 Tax=Candidatus Laterigemmans baculatus TaxID=2770505 RepID=UPI0013D9C9B1|nr:ABC transporter permease [Candidatus Laterigemmans baculatus]